jgi:hypothetical protein
MRVARGVTLARRLAVIMHRIWVDGTVFRWTRSSFLRPFSMVATERNIGHEQRRSHLQGNAYAHGTTWQQVAVAVRQTCACGERSGCRIDDRRRVVEFALVWVAAFGLQPDFDRKTHEIGSVYLTAVREVGANSQHVALR